MIFNIIRYLLLIDLAISCVFILIHLAICDGAHSTHPSFINAPIINNQDFVNVVITEVKLFLVLNLLIDHYVNWLIIKSPINVSNQFKEITILILEKFQVVVLNHLMIRVVLYSIWLLRSLLITVAVWSLRLSLSTKSIN